MRETVDLRKFTEYSYIDKDITANGTVNPYVANIGYGRTNINISRIVDKLIRLAAKYTDRYASDVLIDIQNIIKTLEDGSIDTHDHFFGFRESGVDHNGFIESRYEDELCAEYRSMWRLRTEREGDEVRMALRRVRYHSPAKVANEDEVQETMGVAPSCKR